MWLLLLLLGYYLFIESSAPRKPGDSAVIQSQSIPVNNAYCFVFWYNMHGQNVGTLNISRLIQGDTGKSIMWTKSGDQGNTWRQGAVDVGNGLFGPFTVSRNLTI